MTFTALTVIIIVTALVSLNALNNEGLKNRMMFIPYICKHEKQGYRIFSHIFVHADIPHLAFNMMSLYALGSALEQQFIFEYGFIKGEIHFITLYFLGGLFATLIPYTRNHNNPSYRSLGASGAVSAVFFGFIIWNPFVELRIFGIPMIAWVFGLVYLVLEFWMDKRGGSGIAHDAHMGGAIFGVIFILIINIEKGKEILNLVF